MAEGGGTGGGHVCESLQCAVHIALQTFIKCSLVFIPEETCLDQIGVMLRNVPVFGVEVTHAGGMHSHTVYCCVNSMS